MSSVGRRGGDGESRLSWPAQPVTARICLLPWHGTGRAVVSLPEEQPWVSVEFATHGLVLVSPGGRCRQRAWFTGLLAEG